MHKPTYNIISSNQLHIHWTHRQ